MYKITGDKHQKLMWSDEYVYANHNLGQALITAQREIKRLQELGLEVEIDMAKLLGTEKVGN